MIKGNHIDVVKKEYFNDFLTIVEKESDELHMFGEKFKDKFDNDAKTIQFKFKNSLTREI